MVRGARLATALTLTLSQREREHLTLRSEWYVVDKAAVACSAFERGGVRIPTTPRPPKRDQRPSLSLREREGLTVDLSAVSCVKVEALAMVVVREVSLYRHPRLYF
jgi:hypothetical protein